MSNKISKKDLRRSTILHYKNIILTFLHLQEELGELKYVVPKSYVYEKIHERTGYCVRVISEVLNYADYSEFLAD